MGLYEWPLEERAEEELRLGGALPRMRGLDSKVLVGVWRIRKDLQDTPPTCGWCTG